MNTGHTVSAWSNKKKAQIKQIHYYYYYYHEVFAKIRQVTRTYSTGGAVVECPYATLWSRGGQTL